MIAGVGTDMLQIARAAAALERTPKISQRILRPAEYEQFLQKTDAVRFFAKRFSAKEAIVKALGSGIGNGVGWQHIEISHDALGRPCVQLFDGAQAYAERANISNIHISYTDEQDWVVAFAVAERSN